MRNNAAFKRVLEYVAVNNVTKSEFGAMTAPELREIAWPPNGVRPNGDHTALIGIRRAMAHVFRERLQSRRAARVLGSIVAEFPDASVKSSGLGEYRVRIGDDDE